MLLRMNPMKKCKFFLFGQENTIWTLRTLILDSQLLNSDLTKSGLFTNRIDNVAVDVSANFDHVRLFFFLS